MATKPQTGPQVPEIRRIPRPEEPIPRLAWPTLAVFVLGIGLFIGSTTLALEGVWPWPLSTALNTLACFVLFTPSHEAAHNTISTHKAVNRWIGRLATPFFAPHAGFGLWRYIHMQHHRFTNHTNGDDPDYYTSHGSGWTMPLRWLTIDLEYIRFYLGHLSSRPRAEKIEALITGLAFVGLIAALIAVGAGFEMLVLWLIPTRIAVGILGWSFDYLPHHGLDDTEEPVKTTRNRIGAEPVLTPLMLYQNHHLVHHLHPVIPFYRYIAVWRRNEAAYLENDPPLSTVRGRPLSTDEYRRLRELAEHH
jgi:fatty acid desaturase